MPPKKVLLDLLFFPSSYRKIIKATKKIKNKKKLGEKVLLTIDSCIVSSKQ